jgi:hypothetical protein
MQRLSLVVLGGTPMSALVFSCVLILAQAGGSSPAMNGFTFGAGRILGIVLAVLVGGVLLALIRAGGCRK